MKALTWHGKNDIRCESVPDPKIEHGRDAIIKVTACAICGSDLHLFDGVMPSMEKGDVLGHETMGEVVEVGIGKQEAQGRRSRGGSIHDLLRRMLLLQEGLLLGLRALKPQSQDGREALGPFPRGPLRLFAHVGRLRRRPGGVPPRALCRRRSDQGAAGARATNRSSSCRTSFPRALWRRTSAI